MEKQHHRICRNLALMCIIGVLLSSVFAHSSRPKLQKLGLVGLGASLAAGVGLAGVLPRDDELQNTQKHSQHSR